MHVTPPSLVSADLNKNNSAVEPAIALARSRVDHDGIDFAEHDVDAAGNARHYGAGCHGHESGHQRVFNQILTFPILPNPHVDRKLNKLSHVLSCLVRLNLSRDYHRPPSKLIVPLYPRRLAM